MIDWLIFLTLKQVPPFNKQNNILHCMKSVRIRSFSGPYFPAFGLNTERYGVWTRKTPNTVTFQAVLGPVEH